MTTLGWIIIALMLGAIAQNLTVPQGGTLSKWKNVPLIASILSLNIMSALDAISTIYLISQKHSTELNPAMEALMQHSYLLFFAVKMLITLVATLVCYYYY